MLFDAHVVAWAIQVVLEAWLVCRIIRFRPARPCLLVFIGVDCAVSAIQLGLYAGGMDAAYRGLGLAVADPLSILLAWVALEAAGSATRKPVPGWAYCHATLWCMVVFMSTAGPIEARAIISGILCLLLVASLPWLRTAHCAILALWCIAALVESASIQLGAIGAWQPGAFAVFAQTACVVFWLMEGARGRIR